MCDRRKRPRLQLLPGIAGDLRQCAVGLQDPAIEPGKRHPDWCLLERGPEALLGFPQGSLGALAPGHVSDRRRDEQSLVSLERTDADLDRELGAVLAEAE